MSPTRAPVTPAERSILTGLTKTLGDIESHFCCGGVIPLPSERKLSLLYNVGQENIARSLDLPPTKDADVDELLDACVPSSHGRGNETVYDESYRLARELPQGNFALTGPTGGLTAHLYKLNIYGIGGFFKAHRDTPKSDRHIGTIVVALPIPFGGGALRVKHENKEVLFNWGDVSASSAKSGLPWAFLFSDVEHEVLPVTFGTRVTLAYDIFACTEASLAGLLVMDAPSMPFYSDLKAALKNPEFLPNGGKLGVALSHEYPVEWNNYSENFAPYLKGGDAVLYRATQELGIRVALQAVFMSDGGDVSELEKYKDIPNDGYGPILYPIDGKPYTHILLTSAHYSYLDLMDVEWELDGMGQTNMLMEYTGAHVQHDIVWMRRPSKDVYTPGGYYMAYGNQHSVEVVYIAAALVLDIPAMQQGVRIAA